MARRRRRKGGSDQTVGVLLIVIGVLIAAALGGVMWWLSNSKVVLDAELCPKSGPNALHVIMIDRSDPITPQQTQRVRQYIERAKTDAVFGTRFELFTFEGDVKSQLNPIFRVCAPPRPEQANELVENPETIRRRYEERFSAALARTSDELMQTSTQPTSPIIESLRAAAITAIGPFTRGSLPIRLTMVSDLIQNTNVLNQFRSDIDFTRLSKTSAWPSLRPALKGAQVDILYLLRPGALRAGAPIQSRGHQMFWEQLVADGGGQIVSFDPM